MPIDVDKEQLKEIRDARKYTERFFYHWAIVSGATLTVAINFAKDLVHLSFYNILFLRTALLLITISLPSALLSNLTSARLTAKSPLDFHKHSNILNTLKFFCKLFSWAAVIFYIMGLILLVNVFVSMIL